VIVTGSCEVAAPAAELWAALSDPARLGDALPGVDAVDVEDDRRFNALVRPATGLGQTPFAMSFQIAERREPEHVRVEGSGAAGDHQVVLTAELDLLERDFATEVRWAVDVHLHGVLASLLQRSLPALVTHEVEQVVTVGLALGAGAEVEPT
jgi:carbon monoxide dehydrogenase subunit G